MKINACFILGAGLGTRMGEAGKVIPKPLFPVFNLSLLEILLIQLRDLEVEKVFVNTFHQHELIQRYIKQRGLSCDVIVEDKLYGSGGAFYNLKTEVPELDTVLSINSDILFDIQKSDVESLLEVHQGTSDVVTLGTVTVDESSLYNRLECSGSMLKKIVSPEKGKNITETFSGVSLVNLKFLEKKFFGQVTNFFESVADFKEKKVGVCRFENKTFHDFGTEKNFIEQIRGIIKNKNNSFFSKHLEINTESRDEVDLSNEFFEFYIEKNKVRARIR